MKNILITGAAGFIGANFAEHMVKKYGGEYNLIVFDKLTYAGNLHNLDSIKDKITFVQGDICNFEFVKETFEKYNAYLVKVPNEKIDGMFRELHKYNVSLIREIQYTLEKYFMEKVIGVDVNGNRKESK